MGRGLFQYHPVIGYHFIPDLKARVDHEGGGFLLRTNGAGFRCRHEFVPDKRPGAFRVLLFGDSYTAGDGVSDKDRYGDVLETLVPGLEVFNFGLSGSGTDQQYLIWREMARQIEHDLVIVAVLLENIRRVAARYRPYADEKGALQLFAKPYFTLESEGELRLHQVPVPKDPIAPDALPAEEREFVDQGGGAGWLRRAVTRMGPSVKDLMQHVTRYQPLPQYDRADDPSWRLMRAILEKWFSELRMPVVLFPIPIYQYIEETASAENAELRFRELHAPPRVTVHDPLPDYWKLPRAERRTLRFAVDPHPTPAAHRVLAESLARHLRPRVAGERKEAV